MMMKQSVAAMAVWCLAAASMAHAQPIKIFKCTVVSVEDSPPRDPVHVGDAKLTKPVRVGDAQLLRVGLGVWVFWDENSKNWGVNWCGRLNPAVSTNPVVSCKSSRGLYAMTRNWVHATRPITAEDDFNRATSRWEEIGHETRSDAAVTFRVDRDCTRTTDPASSLLMVPWNG
jgi:hypothetical protein